MAGPAHFPIADNTPRISSSPYNVLDWTARLGVHAQIFMLDIRLDRETMLGIGSVGVADPTIVALCNTIFEKLDETSIVTVLG
jgi:hypothetical protein